MSIYVFRCENCKKNVDVEIEINKYDKEKNNQLCKKCGQKMSRVFTPLMGTDYKCKGFYDTDVRGVKSR